MGKITVFLSIHKLRIHSLNQSHFFNIILYSFLVLKNSNWRMLPTLDLLGIFIRRSYWLPHHTLKLSARGFKCTGYNLISLHYITTRMSDSSGTTNISCEHTYERVQIFLFVFDIQSELSKSRSLIYRGKPQNNEIKVVNISANQNWEFAIYSF